MFTYLIENMKCIKLYPHVQFSIFYMATLAKATECYRISLLPTLLVRLDPPRHCVPTYAIYLHSTNTYEYVILHSGIECYSEATVRQVCQYLLRLLFGTSSISYHFSSLKESKVYIC